MKKWSGVSKALLSYQILVVSTQRKYSYQFEKPNIKLESKLESESNIHHLGVIWTPSFLALDPNVNPNLRVHTNLDSKSFLDPKFLG